ncbi:4Fe-4S dicluster domain-containing protein [bacterium]|nr:MAG: 4Fe-4S dicluster domain-containing protein [bacterium]
MTEEKKRPVKMEDVKAKADEKQCAAQKALTFVEEFLAEPMCGRCFPCSMGTYEAQIRLKRVIAGSATEEDIAAVKKIADVMREASMCKKGKDTAQYLQEDVDLSDLSEHIAGLCQKNECSVYTTYMIIPENCTLCGDCLDVCKDNAIIGEKKKPYFSGYLPFEIVQKRCTKCGECLRVCRFEAVKTLSSKELAEAEKVEA